VRARALVLLVLVAAGCGGKAAAPVQGRHVVRPSPDCTAAAPGYRTCFAFPGHPATIERRVGSEWKLVTGPLKPADPTARWGLQVRLSPDKRTLLADWDFPCDSSVTVFVPATGGVPRLVTGERDWRRAPISRPLGWTTGGKARVTLYTSWRGIRVNPAHPKVLLFDPNAPAADARPAPPRGC